MMSERTSQSSSEFPLDDILLAIARRADEIAQMRLFPSALNACCWFKAEEEMLGFKNSSIGITTESKMS